MAGRPEYIKLPQSPSDSILSPASEYKANFHWPRVNEPKRSWLGLRRRGVLLLVLVGLAGVGVFGLLRASAVDSNSTLSAKLAGAWDKATSAVHSQQQQQPEEEPQLPVEAAAVPPAPRGKFLVAAYVNEQETKAQSHLYDLAILARSLGRTFVLPNADHARFGPCHSHPFELFYEPDALSAFGVGTISQSAFDERMRGARPTAQILRFENDDRPESITGKVRAATQWTDPVDFLNYRAPCLAGHDFDFSGRPMLVASKPRWKPGFPREKVTAFGRSMATQLREWEDRTEGTDVLLIEIMWREHFITEHVANELAPDRHSPALPFSFLEYGSIWHDFAASMARHLSPFVAVHWRMETHPTEGLAECGVSLVEKLLRVHNKHPTVTNVYVLMDYPLDSLIEKGEQAMIDAGDTSANSDSFQDLGDVHHHAVAGFVQAMRERAPGLRLTTTRQVQHEVAFPSAITAQISGIPSEGGGDVPAGLDQLDKSLVGMIDKLVASQSELFLSSAWHGSLDQTCGRYSSFTRNILSLREEAYAKQRRKKGEMPGTLWEVGDLFYRHA